MRWSEVIHAVNCLDDEYVTHGQKGQLAELKRDAAALDDFLAVLREHGGERT